MSFLRPRRTRSCQSSRSRWLDRALGSAESCNRVKRSLSIEPLEMRRVLSVSGPGTITGNKFLDVTGDGITADDLPMPGVTIQLFKDNNDDVFNVADDALQASQQTDATGMYCFQDLVSGTYWVREIVPAGYTRTFGQNPYKIVVGTAGQQPDISDIVIDSFDPPAVGQQVLINLTDPNPTLLKQTGGTLGNQRDILMSVLGSPIPISVAASVGGGDFFFSTAGTPGATTILQYDGVDADVPGPPASLVNNMGLSTDLTNGGKNNRIIFDLKAVDGGNNTTVELKVNLTGPGGATASFSGFVPENINPASFTIPFSAFTLAGGFSFTSVTSIQAQFNMSGVERAEFDLDVIKVSPPEPEGGFDFANAPLPSSIAGCVYVDIDNDGIKDPGEAVIPGVTITLTGTDMFGNAVNRQLQTDANGCYLFDDLVAGTYKLTESQPAAFIDGKDTIGSPGGNTTNDMFANIQLPPGFDGVDNNFGELPFSSIAGFVYKDVDNDGIKDPGEAPIAGVSIALIGTDVFGNPVALNTMTDANGFYIFNNLVAGTYKLTESQPVDCADGKDTIGTPGGTTTNDMFANIPLGFGVDGVNNNFGELPFSSIAGFVYKDVDNDGIKDPGEAPIAGVTITLTGTDVFGNAVNKQLQTDANGFYDFTLLVAGTYKLTETQPVDCADGKDTVGTPGGVTTNDMFANIQLPAGFDGVNNNFGELPFSSIAGFVYKDTDNDGIKDPGEAPIAGVTITLTGTDVFGNAVNKQLQTDANGFYDFTLLVAGTYKLTETQPVDCADGKDTVGTPGGVTTNDMFANIQLGAGVDGVNNNFGELPFSSIAGFVYKDTDNDGVKDPGELPIAGVTVTLTGTDVFGNAVNKQLQTDANGFYKFDLLVAGTYKLTETQPVDCLDGKDTIGTPGGTTTNDMFSDIQLPAGFDGVNNNFGELPINSSLSGFVYKDLDNDGVKDPGETAIANVKITLTGNTVTGAPVDLMTFTDGNGFYIFPSLQPGTYKLTETQPVDCADGKDTVGTPGGTTTNDMFANIQLGAGVDGVNNNFGELPFSSIAGFVYKDTDNDGVKDPGEAPIAGVTITLTGTDVFGNAVNRQLQTDANGFYDFTQLVAGTYKLTETQPIDCADGKDTVGTPGGTTTNDMFANIQLPVGFDGVNNNFGELPFSSIAGFVYKDTDNDGVKDPGEAPIAGVTITLTGTDVFGNAVNKQLQTDANGFYDFTQLVAGTYKLTEIQPVDCADGKDTVGTPGGTTTNDMFANIQLPVGFDGVNNNFGELPFSSIAGFVYKDTDNDGIKDPGEAPIAGVTITLTGTDVFGNAVNKQLQTDANGFYDFTQLVAGTYKLTEIQPIDCADGKDTVGTPGGTTTNDMFANIQLPVGFDGVNNNFGELPFSSIAGFVYKDTDNDGVKDPGEAPIAGVTITLTGTDVFGNAVNKQLQTDANGFYDFTQLVAGTYKLTEIQPIDCADGKDTVGTPGGTTTNDMFANIQLPIGFDGVNNNFGELPFSSIAGFVYKDTDNDGVKDPGEAPIAGVTITLTGTDVFGNAVNKQLQTDANGFYDFTQLVAGTYKLTEIQPVDCADGKDTVGTPGGTTTNDMFANIQLPVGFDGVNNNFGELPFSSIAGFVYKDIDNDGVKDPGEAPIAGVTITLTGTDVFGNAVNKQLQTDANGFYDFTQLVAGTYKLTETQPIDCADGKDTVGTPGGTTTNDMFANIQLPVGFDGVNNNFGELPFSSLAGCVYKDLDNDGIKDAGEAPIAGVTIILTGTDVFGNAVNKQLQTDADGCYTFDQLVAGTYKLTETQPLACADGKDTVGTQGGTTTNDMFANIQLGPGVDGVNNNFGELPFSSLAGCVYKDIDNDGVKDMGEAPIAGVTIILTGTDVFGNAVNRQVQTDANGCYLFDQLVGGTYKLTEQQPVDCADGQDTVGTPGGTTTNDMFSNIQLPIGFDGVNNNFGELPFSSLAGCVYKDLDNDGIFDAGEAPIAGVTIILTGTDVFGNAVNRQLQTDADGCYEFNQLVAGTYKLTEVQPVDCADGKDSIGTPGGNTVNDMFTNIPLGPGVDGVGNNFGELPFSSLAGCVYKDVDNDGIKDPGEGVQPGVTIILTGTDVFGNPVNRQVQTGADGCYTFDQLVAGTYKLTEVQPVDCADGKDSIGTPGGNTTNDMFTNIQLGPGVQGLNNNFGELPFSSISGYVYVDYNNDGNFDDPIEPPIPGTKVTLTGTDVFGNAVMQMTVTDANGYYLFDHLVGGNYKLTETQPFGFEDGKDTIGTPGGTTTDDMFSNINLPIDFDGVQNNFGEIKFSCLSGWVYVDQDNDGVLDFGELGIPEVKMTLTGVDVFGNNVMQMLETNACGFYHFQNLIPGTYKITETQHDCFIDGKDTAGDLGGVVTNDMIADIVLPFCTDGTYNNFGERGLKPEFISKGLLTNVQLPNLPAAFPPTIKEIKDIVVTDGDVVKFDPMAFVPNNGNVTWSFGPNAPAGATLDPQTGEFCWTATTGQQPTVYTVTLKVEDRFWSKDEEVFNITVQPRTAQNNPPIAQDDNVNLLEDAATTLLSVLGNDSTAPDVGETLTITGVSGGSSGGTISVAPGGQQISYRPAANFVGIESFNYTVSDGHGGFDTATVFVTVTPVNDAPGFTKGPNVTVNQNSGDFTQNNWATNLTRGPANEVGQSLSFMVTGNTNPALFATAPFVTPAGTLFFVPALNATGSSTITLKIQDDGGTANGGQDSSATQTFVVTVNPTTAPNTAPVNGVPTGQAVLEDGTLTFSAGNGNALTVSDADAGANPLRVTVAVTNGVFSLSGTSGLAFTVGDGSQDATMTFTGSQSSINAALAGSQYRPTANFNGAAQLSLTTNDQGNSGTGGALQDADNVAITVTPVNDAPSFTKGADQTVNQNSGAQTVAGWATNISRGPANESGQTVSFVVTNNTNAALFSVAPSIASNGNLTYTPANGATGSATITLRAQDNGGTANGGQDSSPTQTFVINVNQTTAPNTAPVNVVPAGQNVLEDGTLTFSAGNGNALSVSDADAGANPLRVTVAVTNGVFSLSGVTGLTFTTGDGVQDATMTFTGSQAAINTALAGSQYRPTANFNGAAQLSLTTNDQGNTGSGGALQDADNVAITVTPVNDAPSFTKGADQTVNQDSGAQTVAGWATGISPGPANESGQAVNFVVTNNTNAALFAVAPSVASNGTLTYTPATGATGSATITLRAQDNGGTANGGEDSSATQTFVINVTGTTGVNAPPVNNLPAAQTINEDTARAFSVGNGNVISISDPDVGGGSLLVVMNVTPGSGTLTLSGATGLTFVVGDGVADSAMSFSGTLANINNALSGMVFTPTLNFNGPVTLGIVTNDQGNTGTGGARQDSDNLTINVTPINDPPSFTKGADISVGVNSGNSINLNWATNISVGPTNELLEPQFIAAVNVTADKPQLFSTQPAVTTSGVLTFTPANNVSGTALVSVQMQDSGGTANGGQNLSTLQTFLITIGQANQAPSFTKGANQTAANDAGAQTVPNWATSISAGPSTESWQTVDFLVQVDKPALFSVQPTIAPNGTLTYTPAPGAAADTANITVRIHDNGGTNGGGVDTSAAQVFTIGITSSSTAPVLAPIGNLSIDELTDFNLQLMSTSALPVTYTMTLGAGFDPGNLPSLTTGGLFGWLPLEDANATQSVFTATFRVTANDGQFDEETVQITVNEVNQPPVFGPIAAVDTIVGIPLSLDFDATDSDLPPQGLTWSISGGPVGNTATINPATGVFSWTPGAGDSGNQTFNVTVTDSGSPPLATTRQLNVNVGASGSGPRINAMFLDDTGASNSDGVSSRVDIKGTVIFEGANLMAFTGSFSDAAPGADPVDLILEGFLAGSGNVRTFSLDEGAFAVIRTLQGLGGTFPNGAYQLTLTAKDAANVTTQRVINMTFDTVAPNTPSTLDLAPGFMNGDGSANAQVVTLVGVADPNVTVVLNNTRTTTTAGDGSFSFTNVTLNPANVATDLQLVSVDLAGNTSSALARSITFKPGAPAAPAAPFAALRTLSSAASSNAAEDDAPLHERHGSLLVLRGTDGDDTFEITSGDTIVAVLNGVRYELDRSEYDAVEFDGLAGDNHVTIHGSSADETLMARPTAATLTSASFRITVACATSLTVDGGGGNDRAIVRDSVGNDRLTAGPSGAEMTGENYSLSLSGFKNLRVQGSAGFDRAELTDSAGDDQFVARPDSVQLAGAGYLAMVRGFDLVRATASTGNDAASFYDSAGDDQLIARPDFAQLIGPGYLNTARGFDSVRAFASTGRDTSVLYDSTGDDQLSLGPNEAQLAGLGYSIATRGFDSTRAYASSGNDSANFRGSSGSDRLTAKPTEASMSGPGYQNLAGGFDKVHAQGGGGADVADLYDSSGDDQFTAGANVSQLSGPGFLAAAESFTSVRAYSGSGNDTAVFHSSGTDDRFSAVDRNARLNGNGLMQSASGFGTVRAFGGGAQATLHDSALDSRLSAAGNQATLSNSEIAYWLFDFHRVAASASNGFQSKEVSAIDFVLETDDWTDGL